METQMFEKKSFFFQGKNYFGQFFSRFIKYEKPRGTLFRCPEGIVTVIVPVLRSFRQDPRGR